MSNTFCILPFIHMQHKPSGQMKPCCRFEFHNQEYKTSAGGHLFDEHNLNNGSTLSSSQNSELWESIRQKLLNNEAVGGCSKCYAEETKTGFSMRTDENNIRNNGKQDGPDRDVSKPIIEYLEMTFGNYCNLKCRTCNADLSSTWWEDENQLVSSGKYPDRFYYLNRQGHKVVNVPFNWQKEDFVNVKEIKFTGGEPMIHPDFLKLMDMLIEMDVAKNIKLDVFTNCSWSPGEKYRSRLRKFKSIVLSLSIDGTGKINEYIRHPSKWETVDAAVTEWLALEHANRQAVQVIWNPTVNIYNIAYLGDMVDWWFKKNDSIDEHWIALTIEAFKDSGEPIPAGKLKFNVLQDPKYLSISMLKAIDWSAREKVICDMLSAVGQLDWRNKKAQQYLLRQSLFSGLDNAEVPAEVKEELKQKILVTIQQSEFTDHTFISDTKTKFKKIINNAKAGGGSLDDVRKFLEYTNDLDKMREEKFEDICPDVDLAIKKTLEDKLNEQQ